MVLAVPPENVDRLIALFAQEDVEATDIGVFRDDQRLHLRIHGHEVGDLDMEFLHKGYPQLRRQAIWERTTFEEPDFDDPPDLTSYLKEILASPNVCSKEWVIRQYDHEVQGGSVLKPLVGARNDGPGDACVIQPLFDSKKGIILSNGLNPQYGKIDPYHMAASAIDEALRQIIAVGGNLDRTALLDNFCWGNPAKPDRLGGLVRAAMACYDIARIYGTPFISGKDSLNNEVIVGGESISIPPTLLISAISVIEDIEKTISMDLKGKDHLLYVVGRTYDELGGSHYYRVRGYVGNNVPEVRAEEAKRTMEALANATSRMLVHACHDCSEGGLGVATAEMAFAGEVGLDIELARVPRSAGIARDDAILFSESNSRFLVEVPPGDQQAFEEIMAGTLFSQIGRTMEEPMVIIRGIEGHVVVHSDLMTLKECWQAPMREI
jgi:phosphoribosylformylglycinamidine synthase